MLRSAYLSIFLFCLTLPAQAFTINVNCEVDGSRATCSTFNHHRRTLYCRVSTNVFYASGTNQWFHENMVIRPGGLRSRVWEAPDPQQDAVIRASGRADCLFEAN